MHMCSCEYQFLRNVTKRRKYCCSEMIGHVLCFPIVNLQKKQTVNITYVQCIVFNINSNSVSSVRKMGRGNCVQAEEKFSITKTAKIVRRRRKIISKFVVKSIWCSDSSALISQIRDAIVRLANSKISAKQIADIKNFQSKMRQIINTFFIPFLPSNRKIE